MAFEIDRWVGRTGRNPLEGLSISRAPRVDTAPPSAGSILMVALLGAMSGLIMGLCFALAFWPLAAFITGAILAGITVWYARGALEE